MAEVNDKKAEAPAPGRVTKDSLISARDLGEIAGFSAQYLGRLAKEEGLPKEPNGKFRLGLAWKFFIDYAVRHAEQTEAEDDSKSRLLATKAKLEELKLARELRQTITIKFASEQYATLIGALRSQLLTIPKKVAPILKDGMTPGEREAVITRAVHDAMRELSTLPEKLREGAPEVEEEPEDHSSDE